MPSFSYKKACTAPLVHHWARNPERRLLALLDGSHMNTADQRCQHCEAFSLPLHFYKKIYLSNEFWQNTFRLILPGLTGSTWNHFFSNHFTEWTDNPKHITSTFKRTLDLFFVHHMCTPAEQNQFLQLFGERKRFRRIFPILAQCSSFVFSRLTVQVYVSMLIMKTHFFHIKRALLGFLCLIIVESEHCLALRAILNSKGLTSVPNHTNRTMFPVSMSWFTLSLLLLAVHTETEIMLLESNNWNVQT